jgi:hypothetical protein
LPSTEFTVPLLDEGVPTYSILSPCGLVNDTDFF